MSTIRPPMGGARRRRHRDPPRLAGRAARRGHDHGRGRRAAGPRCLQRRVVGLHAGDARAGGPPHRLRRGRAAPRPRPPRPARVPAARRDAGHGLGAGLPVGAVGDRARPGRRRGRQRAHAPPRGAGAGLRRRGGAGHDPRVPAPGRLRRAVGTARGAGPLVGVAARPLLGDDHPGGGRGRRVPPHEPLAAGAGGRLRRRSTPTSWPRSPRPARPRP